PYCSYSSSTMGDTGAADGVGAVVYGTDRTGAKKACLTCGRSPPAACTACCAICGVTPPAARTIPGNTLWANGATYFARAGTALAASGANAETSGARNAKPIGFPSPSYIVVGASAYPIPYGWLSGVSYNCPVTASWASIECPPVECHKYVSKSLAVPNRLATVRLHPWVSIASVPLPPGRYAYRRAVSCAETLLIPISPDGPLTSITRLAGSSCRRSLRPEVQACGARCAATPLSKYPVYTGYFCAPSGTVRTLLRNDLLEALLQ